MCMNSPGAGRKKWLINKNVYISVAYACAHKLCKVSVFFVYDKIFSKDSLETVTALSFKKVLCFRKAFYFIAVEV